MGETRDLLQGIYGLDSKGKFEDVKRLPAVQSLPEVRATRTRLEKFLNDEEQAGLPRPEAVDKAGQGGGLHSPQPPGCLQDDGSPKAHPRHGGSLSGVQCLQVLSCGARR